MDAMANPSVIAESCGTGRAPEAGTRSATPPLEAHLQMVSVRALLLGNDWIRGSWRAELSSRPRRSRSRSRGGGPPCCFATASSSCPHVTEKFAVPEKETLRLLIRPDSDQIVDAADQIILRDGSLERLQLVADILAKNLVLSHYETRIGAIFDRVEPLAAILKEKGRAGAPGKELLRHIGDVLLMQQKIVGRVETGENPELVWARPELDRLYMRLAEEYELRERSRALDRKLEVVSRTVETLLGLVQTRSSM